MGTLTRTTHMFTVRLPHEDFGKLDELAAAIGCDRGHVAKKLIKLASLEQLQTAGTEPPGKPGDVGAGATTYQADAPALSDRL